MTTSENNSNEFNQIPGQRVAERWLLVGPDETWRDRARKFLVDFSATSQASSFLSWRMKFGLLRVACASDVEEELTQALKEASSPDTQRSAAKVWAALSEKDWYERTSECATLQLAGARGFKVRLFSELARGNPGDALHRFALTACEPDTLPRLTWQMNGHPLPLPRKWLALAPLPELDSGQNELMADEGFKCYATWAEEVLGASDSEEELALWGRYSDDEELLVTDEPQDDTEIDNVVDLDAKREQRVSLTPPPRWTEASYRMAAASASGGVLDMPVYEWDWSKTSTVSRGATELKAYCHRPDAPEEKLPRVEFVARWSESKKMSGKPEDLCLVITLSKRKPVLIKGERDKDDSMQVHFKWPANRWPQDMPTRPQATKIWLREHLDKARVSLQ